MDRLDVMALYARVVETGSFSRAGDEFALGQPAVSKRIAALEARLGARLLERTTRRLRPTEAGRDYYERCRRLVDEADDLETQVRRGTRAAAGRIRVAAPMGFGRMYLMPLVVRFLAANPDAAIDLVMNDRFVDLTEEGVDLAIRIANLGDSGLHARRLGDTPRALVAAPAYLRRRGSPRTPADLDRHDFIVYAYFDNPERLALAGPEGEAEVRVKARLRVNNAEAMREAALGGLGICPIPLWAVDEALASGTLRMVLPGWRPPSSAVHLVYSSARYLPTRVRVFMDYLARELRLPAAR
jgi:DNA-binding transcriptional LysR family regulator